MTLLAPDGALENQTEVRVGGGVVGGRPSLILASLTPTLPAGHPAEVPGPQWHHHWCTARGHWGLSPLLDEPPADPGHPALRVPVSPPSEFPAPTSRLHSSAKAGSGGGPDQAIRGHQLPMAAVTKVYKQSD